MLPFVEKSPPPPPFTVSAGGFLDVEVLDLEVRLRLRLVAFLVIHGAEVCASVTVLSIVAHAQP